ncbi:MAG: Ribonuclease [Pedosphaera sp.]|nr:Ribonuclease [Pedosphaera sp.]
MIRYGMAKRLRLKEFWDLLKAAVNAWFADRAQRLGASLAFYTVLALPPLFVIVLFIVSLWVSAASARTEIFTEISALLGDQGAKALESILVNPQQHSNGLVASAIAIGTLLITATGVFMELQDALNLVWGVEEKPGQGWRGFIKNRLLSFALIVGIGFLLLVSLLVNAGLEAADKYFGGLLPGAVGSWRVVNTLVSLGVVTLLFALIFKVLPDAKIAWRDVWVGATITALLFTAGKFLIGMYLGRSTVVSAYGAAGSAIIVLLWVYYSAQILYFGAELTQAYACRFGSRIEPKENAQWINPAKCPKAGEA